MVISVLVNLQGSGESSLSGDIRMHNVSRKIEKGLRISKSVDGKLFPDVAKHIHQQKRVARSRKLL